MEVNEYTECRICKNFISYINKSTIYCWFGFTCSIDCINISKKIKYYPTKHGRNCEYCKYLFNKHDKGDLGILYCLSHHCTIPIKNKYMNININ